MTETPTSLRTSRAFSRNWLLLAVGLVTLLAGVSVFGLSAMLARLSRAAESRLSLGPAPLISTQMPNFPGWDYLLAVCSVVFLLGLQVFLLLLLPRAKGLLLRAGGAGISVPVVYLVFDRFLDDVPLALSAMPFLWPTCIWLLAANQTGGFATALIIGLSVVGNAVVYTFLALICYLLWQAVLRVRRREHSTKAI